jgi:hypothetical protein
MVSKAARTGLVVALAIVVFWVWYSVAADFSYRAVSGKYTLKVDGETSVLVLNQDQTFQQVLSSHGKTERAEGSWRRVGEGGVVFSKEFLGVSGQERRPDGQTDGEVRKRFGLFASIHLNRDPGGPVFYKQPFR